MELKTTHNCLFIVLFLLLLQSYEPYLLPQLYVWMNE